MEDKELIYDLIKNYCSLLHTEMWWPLVARLACQNQEKLNFKGFSTSFNCTNEEKLELVNDFFQNGTNKAIYKIFSKILMNNQDNIKFISQPAKDDEKLLGETILMSKDKYLINVYLNNNFGDIITLAHEFGHAIHMSKNKDRTIYRDLNPSQEIISSFFELLFNDYCMKLKNTQSIQIPAHIYSYKEQVRHAKIAKKMIDKLEFFHEVNDYAVERDYSTIQAMENLLKTPYYKNLFKGDADFNYFPYATGFVVACNLVDISQKDLEYALYLVKRIMKLKYDGNGTRFVQELGDMGVLNNKRIDGYFQNNKEKGLKLIKTL